MDGKDRRGVPDDEWPRTPRTPAPSHRPLQGRWGGGDDQHDADISLPDWLRNLDPAQANRAPTSPPAPLPPQTRQTGLPVPGAPQIDALPTAPLLEYPGRPADTMAANADTAGAEMAMDERPTTVLPSPRRRGLSGKPPRTDEVADDDQPTTVLPTRGQLRERWAPRRTDQQQMDGGAGAPKPGNYPDGTAIDQLETGPLPDKGTLLRDVTYNFVTGPLPIIDIDQHFTGPLPTIVVDRNVGQDATQQDTWSRPWPNGPVQRAHLVPPEEEQRLDELASMSTVILPAIPGEPGTFASSGTEQAADTGETARTKAARAAHSHTFVLNLAKSSGVYALSALAAPLVSLVLAPFLTHHLTPNEYGVLAVLTTAVGLVAGITQLGLNSAFFRAYNYDYTTTHDRHGVVSTIWLLLVGVGLPVCAGIVYGAPLIAQGLLGDPGQAPLVRIAGLVCLAQNLTVPGYAWLRAESKALYFSLLSIVSLVVTLVTNIVFVGVMGFGLAGATAALGTGYASVVICTTPFLIFRAGLRYRRDIAVSALAFGLPLVLNFTSYWVLQLSDRFLLARMSTLTETAQYAVAYTMGSALSALIISPFTLAWPTSMFTIAKRKDAARIFGFVFKGFSAVLYFSAFGLSLLATLFLQRLFPPTYHEAGPIIALIAASIVFYGVYFLFMIGANVKRKTWLTAVFTTAAAAVNVGFNLVLIPRFGGMGAAASTLAAYTLLAGLAYVVNQWIYPLPFQIASWLLMGVVGVALYLACWRLPLPAEPLAAWVCRFGICLLYGLLLFVYGGGVRLIRQVMGRSRHVVSAAGGAIA